MSDTLIKRLRTHFVFLDADEREAVADRIEELERERDAARVVADAASKVGWNKAVDRIEELEALVRDIDKVALFEGVPDGAELQARIDLALGYGTSGEQEPTR